MKRKPLLIAMGLCVGVGLTGCFGGSSSSNGNGGGDDGPGNGGTSEASLEDGEAPWLMYSMDLSSDTQNDAPELNSGLWAVSAEKPEARGVVDPEADLQGPFISLYTETISGDAASNFSVDRVVYLQESGRWATLDTQVDVEDLEPRQVSDVEDVALREGDDYVVQWDTSNADEAYVAWRNNESDSYRAVSLSMDGNTPAHELESGLDSDEGINELLTGLQGGAGEPAGWLALTDANRLVRIDLDGGSVTELDAPVFNAEKLGGVSESGHILLLTGPEEAPSELQPYQPTIYDPVNDDLVVVTPEGESEPLRLQTPEFTFEDEDNEEVTLAFPAPVSFALTRDDKWHFLVTYPIEQLGDEQFSDARLRQFTVTDSGTAQVQASDLYLSAIDPLSDFNDVDIGAASEGVINLSDRVVYRAKVTEEKPDAVDLDEEELDEDYLLDFVQNDDRSTENCAVSFSKEPSGSDASALIEEENTEECFRVSSLGELTAAGEDGAIFWENFAAGNDIGEPVKVFDAIGSDPSVLYAGQWLGGGVAQEEGNAGVALDKRALSRVLISGRQESQELRLVNASNPETDLSSTTLLGAMQDIDAEGLPGSTDNRASLKGNAPGPQRLVLLEADVSGSGSTRRHIAWINVEEPGSLTPLNPIIEMSVGDQVIEERRAQDALTRPLSQF